jgi:hypothetical protein
MRINPNPKRLALLTAVFLIPFGGIWLVEFLKRSRPFLSLPALSLPALDQKHAVAVVALALIAIVGLAKMWFRRH